ncbi:hypothetical protein BIW11_05110 [Tropilaelaps mercedesae]|uniref:Uncharacterized protein n=1 Tax=Tropilaelaps mercedesae TaxID=418985 RepID=A0A1V9Y3R0_9ACAR|nr:hypothetical protein BIW11_05110 [Tropilaelaps mercedesae]
MQRHFLWKHQALAAGPPIILGIVSRKKPLLKIRERILNAAYQTYVDNKQALFVVGDLLCDALEAEGLDVEVNAIRGKPQPGSRKTADFLASCRFCRLAEARSPNDTVLDLVEDVKTKQYSLGTTASTASSAETTLSIRQLTNFFSLDIHGKLEGPNCSIDVSFVCFERRLKAYKISELPLADNTVYKILGQIQKELLWGWIQTSKGRCHLLQKDGARQDATGVWVSRVRSIHHPLVWLVCQHFLNSVQPTRPHAHPNETDCEGSSRYPHSSNMDIFVLIVFDESCDPTFYSVTPIDNVMRTVVLSGVEKTTVTRVFSARDRLVEIPLELCFIDDGEFTFDSSAMYYADRSNSTLKHVRKELFHKNNRLSGQKRLSPLAADRDHFPGGGEEKNENETPAGSYCIAVRCDAPVLLSPDIDQQMSTPATIGAQKYIKPKRIISTLSPREDQNQFHQFDSLEYVSPSAKSTPIDRILRKARGDARFVPEQDLLERDSVGARPYDRAESKKSGDVPPELVDILRKQELEISLLKEQLQMLIVNNSNNKDTTNSKKSGDERGRSTKHHEEIVCVEATGLQQPLTRAVTNNLMVTPHITDGYRQPISPPETPPCHYSPIRPYAPDSLAAYVEENSPVELETDLLSEPAKHKQYYMEDKENRDFRSLWDSSCYQLQLLNYRTSNRAVLDGNLHGNAAYRSEKSFREDHNVDNQKGNQLQGVAQPAASLMVPRLEEQFKALTREIPLHNVPRGDLKNTINRNNIASFVQPPRLQYESLVLKGTQPSVIVDQVTRKYFGRSPQMPTATVGGNALPKPHLLGTVRPSPQIGMLRRVLTAEATKQVLGQNGEVSVVTRKYMQMEDVHINGTLRNERSLGKQHAGHTFDKSRRRFLDVDALKRQPKLL